MLLLSLLLLFLLSTVMHISLVLIKHIIAVTAVSFFFTTSSVHNIVIPSPHVKVSYTNTVTAFAAAIVATESSTCYSNTVTASVTVVVTASSVDINITPTVAVSFLQ